MKKVTESSSNHNDLHLMSTAELLRGINSEDKSVPLAVEAAMPSILDFIEAAYEKMAAGGRLFYIGAGTSGRLGIVDASECPPTFGVDHNKVIGLMAGGDGAMRKAVEFAEDDVNGAWKDLAAHSPTPQDVLVGIAASGTTPYVIGGVQDARKHNMVTGCITCNLGSPLAEAAEFPIEVVVGPEFVTGSTRMKAGTAQKLVLNMISTALMIKLGHVVGNKMVDMQLSNNKLVDRGAKMVAEQTGLDYTSAEKLLLETGSVRKAVEKHNALR